MQTFSKRSLLGAPLAAALGLSATTGAQSETQPGCTTSEAAAVVQLTDLPAMAPGPFTPAVESLKTYKTPEWFRDAKFGIWAHWGPSVVARQGDWYARFMYVPGHPHYEHHLKTYGHPSQFGYKDLIPLWKAEKFDPEALMDKYVAAGAKYFFSMGVHHDNFDLWNSRHHRWNAAVMGPKRDMVGAWRDAARRRGLKFGVSEHLGASFTWFYPSHQYDQFWPKLGVNYDGADPRFKDLYHDNHGEIYRGDSASWYTKNPAFHKIWYNRIRDLIDSYQPDLLYSDGGIPFGGVGRSLLAHFYNSHISHSGTEAVYFTKDFGSGEFYPEAGVQDVERGVMKGINPRPWQTDTSIGDWYYSENYTYKTAPEIITLLADIVSKNGNLLLNVVQYPDGSLPPQSETFLSEMAAWMKINAEAIHGTRPWKLYGEGPTEAATGAFKEGTAYKAEDIRFTTKGRILYAITLGEPSGTVAIKSLGRKAALYTGSIQHVHLLGVSGGLPFRQTDDALLIDMPAQRPCRHASAFRIS